MNFSISFILTFTAGNITEASNKDTSVTLDTVVDSKTKIGVSYSPTTATKENVQVTFTNNSGQSGLTLKYQIGSQTGTWNTYTEPVTMTTNGKVYARLFDANNQYTNTATATIQNIDRIAPNVFNLSTTKTTNSITVTGSTTDTATAGCAAENYGIRGYQFQLKDSAGSVITSWTTETTATSYTFNNLTQGTTYKVSMRAIDKAGNSTEATNKDESVTLNTVVDSKEKIGISYNPTTPTTENVQVTFTNNSGDSSLTLKYQKGSQTGEWLNYTGPVEMTTNGYVYARLFDENGQYTNTATANVNNIDREKPVISSATASTSWGKTNSVTIKATDTGTSGCASGNIGIVGYGINQSSTTEPSYTTVTATTSLNTTINNITANGTYYVWVKDQAGNTRNKQVTVNRIDTTAPTTATLTSSNIEETTFTLTATGTDGESGIAKYEFYLNGTLEKTIETTSGTATYNVTGKTGGQSYKYKVRVYDKIGLYKESEEITVTTESPYPLLEEVAKIGDYVNYSVEVDGRTYDSWCIGNLDNNGHVEILCMDGPQFIFGSDTDVEKAKSDYVNGIKLLNDASEPYKNGKYGYSVRHLGTNPRNPDLYATIPAEYVYDYKGKIDSDRRAYLEQNYYEIDPVVRHFIGGMECWIAARALYLTSYGSFFGMNQITIDYADRGYNFYFLYSDGRIESEEVDGYSLAPVVSLETGVKVLSGDGKWNNPWKLTK